MRREEARKWIDPVIASPREPGLFFLGFKAWAVAPSRDALRENLGPHTTRVVWNDQRDRIAVHATEHPSLRKALEGLADELEANQLAELPPGPPDLGEISFVHPPGVPAAAFFVRGNLTVAVVSFTGAPMDIVPVAKRVDDELRARPREARQEGVSVESTTSEDALVIRATPRWASEDGYLKVFAPDARLESDGKSVTVHGGQTVEVFYVEPGRETYSTTVKR